METWSRDDVHADLCATHGGSREEPHEGPELSTLEMAGSGLVDDPREMSRKMKLVGWWMARARQQRRWASRFPKTAIVQKHSLTGENKR